MFAKYEKPVCPYCNKPAVMATGKTVYPTHPTLKNQRFWVCHPCNAWVGCHTSGAKVGKNKQGQPVYSDGAMPLGRLANADLRRLKQKAHAKFDPNWKSYSNWLKHPAFDPKPKHDSARRKLMYAWLAEQMKIPVDSCHIGSFDEEQCRQVIALCGGKDNVGLSMDEKMKELFEAEVDQDFNEWETGFMETMRRTCKRGDSVTTSDLSYKQIEIVERMHDKYCG